MLTSGPLAAAPVGEQVRAGPPARATVAVLWMLALWVLGQVSGSPEAFWWPVVLVGAGVLVSFVVDTDPWFDRWSGAMVALIAFAGLMGVAALGVLVLSVPPPMPSQLWLLVLVPLGLDWNRVLRLRASAVMSGPVVVVLLVTDVARADAVLDGASAILVALGWFGLLSTSLWLLHRDLLGALPRPASLAPVGASPPPVGAGEFALVALGAALVGLVLALLLSAPTCLPWQDCDDSGDRQGGPGTIGSGSGEEVWPGAEADWPQVSDGEGPSSLVVGPDGRVYRFDEQQGRYVRAPELDIGEAMDAADPDAGGEAEPVPTAQEPPSSSWMPWLVAAALLGAALLAAALWWRARAGGPVVPGGTPDWSAAAVRRLQEVGERVGCERGSDESIMCFARRLAGAPGWPGDGRLVEVGALVSRSLFAPTPLTPAQRSWVDAVLDDVEAGDQVDSGEVVPS